MDKQLTITLTDSAVADASHISNAIELDGYFGVYDSITEYLDDYLIAFYKPSKDSILHKYIRTQLTNGLLYEM